jgi:hypothetical protein
VRNPLWLVIAFALAAPSIAAANIRIEQARFEDGMLVVRGEVTLNTPSEVVTLDRKFTVRSGADGKFVFQVRHTPFLCEVSLRTKSFTQSAKVDNCVMNDIRQPTNRQH